MKDFGQSSLSSQVEKGSKVNRGWWEFSFRLHIAKENQMRLFRPHPSNPVIRVWSPNLFLHEVLKLFSHFNQTKMDQNHFLHRRSLKKISGYFLLWHSEQSGHFLFCSSMTSLIFFHIATGMFVITGTNIKRLIKVTTSCFGIVGSFWPCLVLG